MKPSDLRAIFLTGETVYLRSHVMDDKDHAAAWLDTPYPVNSLRAEEILKERHQEFWPQTRYYAICRRETDEIVGGVTINIHVRLADVYTHVARWLDDADQIRAEALELVIPWLSVEWDLITVTADIASDHRATIEAAERLGMVRAGTFREAILRPGNRRVDQLMYQMLNPKGEFPDA